MFQNFEETPIKIHNLHNRVNILELTILYIKTLKLYKFGTYKIRGFSRNCLYFIMCRFFNT